MGGEEEVCVCARTRLCVRIFVCVYVCVCPYFCLCRVNIHTYTLSEHKNLQGLTCNGTPIALLMACLNWRALSL